jgi:hypothetical protein
LYRVEPSVQGTFWKSSLLLQNDHFIGAFGTCAGVESQESLRKSFPDTFSKIFSRYGAGPLKSQALVVFIAARL